MTRGAPEPIPGADPTTPILARRARKGDRQALNRLLERHQERVYRIVRIRMGARLRAALEPSDIVQETFLVAARRIGDFEPRGRDSVVQWLARIAEHQIHDAADRFRAGGKHDPDRTQPLQQGGLEGAPRGRSIPGRGSAPWWATARTPRSTTIASRSCPRPNAS